MGRERCGATYPWRRLTFFGQQGCTPGNSLIFHQLKVYRDRKLEARNATAEKGGKHVIGKPEDIRFRAELAKPKEQRTYDPFKCEVGQDTARGETAPAPSCSSVRANP